MRLCTTHAAVRRVWTVELRPQHGGPVLICPLCTPAVQPLEASSARSAILAHLAVHARRDVLAPHFRTCQCRERGCRWHPRHHGCAGSVLLVLMREHGGRIWRLADMCAACAGAVPHAATVPDTMTSCRSGPARARRRGNRPHGHDERRRVRETLTHLATVLPRFSSPIARLLALQCALRADGHGQVHLPGGLLRAMRLGGHAMPWQELEHAGWLRCLPADTNKRQGGVEAQLLGADALTPAPGRTSRARAAHWALHPAPLTVPRAAPPAIQLTALVLAAHTAADTGRADAENLTRLCGLSQAQLDDLFDQLLRAHVLEAWNCDGDAGEVHWKPRPEHQREP